MADFVIYIDKGADTETTAGSVYNLELAIEIAERIGQTIYAGRKPQTVEVGYHDDHGIFQRLWYDRVLFNAKLLNEYNALKS